MRVVKDALVKQLLEGKKGISMKHNWCDPRCVDGEASLKNKVKSD